MAGDVREALVPALNMIEQEALQRHRGLGKLAVPGLRTEWGGCWGGIASVRKQRRYDAVVHWRCLLPADDARRDWQSLGVYGAELKDALAATGGLRICASSVQ